MGPLGPRGNVVATGGHVGHWMPPFQIQNDGLPHGTLPHTEKEDLVHMKAGHLVKISFGNDRVRTEPWLIRCFRHANVHEVAE